MLVRLDDAMAVVISGPTFFQFSLIFVTFQIDIPYRRTPHPGVLPFVLILCPGCIVNAHQRIPIPVQVMFDNPYGGCGVDMMLLVAGGSEVIFRLGCWTRSSRRA